MIKITIQIVSNATRDTVVYLCTGKETATPREKEIASSFERVINLVGDSYMTEDSIKTVSAIPKKKKK